MLLMKENVFTSDRVRGNDSSKSKEECNIQERGSGWPLRKEMWVTLKFANINKMPLEQSNILDIL